MTEYCHVDSCSSTASLHCCRMLGTHNSQLQEEPFLAEPCVQVKYWRKHVGILQDRTSETGCHLLSSSTQSCHWTRASKKAFIIWRPNSVAWKGLHRDVRLNQSRSIPTENKKLELASKHSAGNAAVSPLKKSHWRWQHFDKLCMYSLHSKRMHKVRSNLGGLSGEGTKAKAPFNVGGGSGGKHD